MPVWALVGQLDNVEGDLESLAAAYRLPVDAILAPVACYRRHKEAIDARLAANAA